MSIRHNGNTILTSGFTAVNLTWEEYEALPDSKLTDGVYYNIIDRNTMPDSEEIQGNKNFLGSVKVQGEDVVTKNKLNNAENLGVIGSNGTITLTKSLDEFNMIVLLIESGNNADLRSNAIIIPTLFLKNRNNIHNCFEISVFNSPSYYASAFVYAPDNAHVVVSDSDLAGWHNFQISVFGII